MTICRKEFAVSALVLAVLALFCPELTAADDFMVLRYSDGHTQSIRLDRSSEAIRQIEFMENRGTHRGTGPFGRDDAIRVIAATYGRNCGTPQGNATLHLARFCDGRSSCEYVIDHQALGDPRPGCAKDYIAEWQCGRDPQRYTQSVRPEAGEGTRITMSCPAR